ncbi:MAG: hypothetical protein LQ347_006132 [Umbilicaria vellea]|nr:MAG: hypothetical protein LQ347_006132 [Umbilicaria vellea]
MPPKKRAPPAEEYSSDGGFVANDDEDERPRSKKVKTESAAKRAGRKITEASGKGIVGGGVSEGEEVFWELSGKKRVTISPFKGKTLVSIREFYEKDGQMLPGRKGIALPTEQFSALIGLLPHIESVLKTKGIELARPVYGAAGAEGEGEEEGEKEEEEEEVDKEKVGKIGRQAKKKNFEATSEEEGE